MLKVLVNISIIAWNEKIKDGVDPEVERKICKLELDFFLDMLSFGRETENSKVDEREK